MRDLKVYPITYTEKIKLLDEFISFRTRVESQYPERFGVGDMTLVTLKEIKEDVARLEDLCK